MIRWFRELLYESRPVEFASSFGVVESVARLKAATVRSVFLSFHKQSAVGVVKEDRVSLQRVIPMVGNSFKPLFVGRFEFRHGQVVLVGRFTMPWFAKAFMTVWFGGILFWTVMSTALVLSKSPDQWWFPLFGLGMLAAGVVLVRVGQWFSRNDAAWLSQVIQSALSGIPPNQALKPTSSPSAMPRLS